MKDAVTLFERVGADVASGCQMMDAAALTQRYYPPVNVGWPLAILQVQDRDAAAKVMAALLAAYPPDHIVTVAYPPLGADADLQKIALSELDAASAFGPATSVYVPPLPPGRDFTDLQETVAHLRSPVGCPWDREQTLSSLRQDLLSECVEVLEAIDLDAGDGEYSAGQNGDHIAEELGDVLLIVTMMLQIAIDEGRFQMAEVADHIVRKLIRRHPHVFGDVNVTGSSDVIANWEAIKVQEKAEKGKRVDSPLDGVPAELPALEKARALQSKAAKAGLLDRSALAYSMPGLAELLGPEPDEVAVGEALWVLTALAREHGVVAENALRAYAVAYRRAAENRLESAPDAGE